MIELILLPLIYLVGYVVLPAPKPRARPKHTTHEPITQPIPVIPVTAINGIPLNPLVRS